ncbi:hypothetical protein SZN_15108 [Streptomyces zinciresistens K42]|uniref:DUF4388 domain-containing protein n=1 Tax=Streptomyces zinciresistens K42 TaxID=700597 RepID=G2GBZ7_9ACTN|nr:hypothetical protein [Streptomyces zinciresistens]EGX59004.1 hypothetical protein SZN_15108 [Streptomyces zinciresistens K42]
MKAANTVPRNLPALLAALHEEERDAAVTVEGTPGGVIHLRRGGVVAVDTPGAPSAESTLLKSGRVEDSAWAAACAAVGSGGGTLSEEVSRRGLLSQEEFEVSCTAALFDGAFALALGAAAEWEVREPSRLLVAARAFPPHLVTSETTRRLAVVNELWGSATDLARTRVRRTKAPAARLLPRHAAVLEAANGRRTPRDIAFALGRGTYAVMLDLAHLRSLGLVGQDAPPPPPGRPSTAPRVPDARTESPEPAAPAPLPQRSPGTHQPPRSATA